MTMPLDYLLDRSNTVLLIFSTFAAISIPVTSSARARIAAGIAAVIVAYFVTISGRSLLEWGVSAVERPSASGLLLLIVCAVSAVTARNFRPLPEFRFATAMLVLGGVLLYPGASGFLNYDSYVLGYGGYLLPLMLATVLGGAIYKRYFFVAAALNIAVLCYLLGLGRSLNLWDYVIDPVAWVIAIVSWIAIAIDALVNLRKPAAAPSPAT